ncbi:hypothetical protein LCGC14_0365260 [marine sediment metagenome]|uniref:Uncharacterized protein n=1 Tax=marine sediment metagenome TaxID=412755 RepID=A0A0F9T6N4_9ZZZZ
MTEIEKVTEEIAKLLFTWLHSSGSPAWASKKTPETVRVAHRKRANQLLDLSVGGGVCAVCHGDGVISERVYTVQLCPTCHGIGRIRNTTVGKLIKLKEEGKLVELDDDQSLPPYSDNLIDIGVRVEKARDKTLLNANWRKVKK